MRALPAALAVLVVALALAPPAQAAWGMPDALTERGKVVEEIYTTIIILGLIVFVIVFVWLVVVIWRFRETTGHGRATHERERHNIKAELAWFLIPLAIVLYIGYIAYGGLVELDNGIPLESVPPENHVLISGSQWSWEAKYQNGVTVRSDPDPITGNVTDNKVFYVPAGKPIAFNVTATDVIHAFQVLDANHAYVMFVDANPLGANKYNKQVASLPEGDYFVQCNKMCLNPGHAIMRARIKAVPEADYNLWLNERAATAGASIVQSVSLRVQDGQLVGMDGKDVGPFTVVGSRPGTRVVLNLTNPSQDVEFTAPDGTKKTIARGEREDPFFAFTVAETGNFTVRASTGDEIVFTGIEAKALTVRLGNFRLEPDHVDLKAGERYLVTIPNVHNTVHDLFIGHYNGGGAAAEIVAASPSVGAGGTGAFLVTVPEDGRYDMWCNQPGHYDQGMHGSVTAT